MQKFSKSPAILEAEKGGKFQMFDGNITGEYIELVSNLIKKSELGTDSFPLILLFKSMLFLTCFGFLSEFTET